MHNHKYIKNFPKELEDANFNKNLNHHPNEYITEVIKIVDKMLHL